MHTAEFLRKLVPLTLRYDVKRGARHSTVGCTPWSQTDLKMSIFCVFVLAMSNDFIFSNHLMYNTVKRGLGIGRSTV